MGDVACGSFHLFGALQQCASFGGGGIAVLAVQEQTPTSALFKRNHAPRQGRLAKPGFARSAGQSACARNSGEKTKVCPISDLHICKASRVFGL